MKAYSALDASSPRVLPSPSVALAGAWNLSDLYGGPEDPRIQETRDDVRARTERFVGTYRGRVASLDGPALCAALEALEAILQGCRRLGQFARLRYAVATDRPVRQAEQAEATRFDAEIDQKLAFFSVELKDLSVADLDQLPGREALADYEHYLAYERIFVPFTLTEAAESTILRKNVTANTAWVDLYTQLSGSLTFPMTVDGEEKVMTRSEVVSFSTHGDRSLRDQAVSTLAEGFGKHRDVLCFVFNTLFEDHRSDVVARGYADTMEYMILRDDLDREVVESLIDTATEHFPLVHRYQALRKRVLGLDDYGMHDLRVPCFGDEPEVSWHRACELVVAAFSAFDPQVGEAAQLFLDREWVDVFPRPGKTGGAFCSPSMPPDHPYVMLNYAGKLGDVFTLAHEFGHCLHFWLALEQRPLNYLTGLPLAETASVFAESWLHDYLMGQSSDPSLHRQLLDRQIRDAVSTGFNQIAYINWERRAHAARAEGMVEAKSYDAIWMEEMRRIWGPEVRLRERDASRWMQIPHFVFARFYCYSYAFGKLLTLSLHNLWKEQGDVFVAKYLDLLRAGGSQRPRDLLSAMDLDLADPTFWGRGCAAVEGALGQLEALVD